MTRLGWLGVVVRAAAVAAVVVVVGAPVLVATAANDITKQ